MHALKLQARLDLGSAEALKAELLEALAGAGAPTLDASDVESIDTSCLQLLAAFTRELTEGARPARWLGASPAFTATAQRLGLTKLLALEALSGP